MSERNNWVWLLVAVLLLTLAVAVPVGGRRAKFQKAAEPGIETFSGTIETVSRHKCEICKEDELSVTLETSAGRLEIRLGPMTFFEEHDFYFSRGDQIQVDGFRFTERGNDLVVANEVRKAGESLLLRGKRGGPAWIDEHGYACPVCGN